MGRWGGGEAGRRGGGEVGRWGGGEVGGGWGDAEMGRWGGGDVGRWGDGEAGAPIIRKYLEAEVSTLNRRKASAVYCRSYPCPGSIAMIAFLHASRFCANPGSSWCCLRSLRTLAYIWARLTKTV